MPRTDLTWRRRRLDEGFYTSQVETPDNQPVRTFLPVGYEPNYPYPLIVFLHGQGGSEEQVLRLAPRLSRRNYICIGLRGRHLVGTRPDGRGCYGWGDLGFGDSPVEDYLVRAVEQTRRNFHVHSERIYLAGVHDGATLAYRLALAMPDRVAGVIALNGVLPKGGPLFRYPDVRQLRAWIGHGIANSVAPLSLARANYRLLYTAGLDVRMQTYPTTHRLHPDMLRDVNRWVMEHVTSEEW
jgi:phospholipase/carboxylesterase